MARIGFVGAGQMGSPMVERLLAAGHDVALHARRPEVRRALAEKGATIVSSPREAASDADVVLACLFSDAQLVEVAEGPDGLVAGLRPGAVLASHVTGPIATVHRLDASAHERGALVVDAPVSGSADDIRAGRLTVLLGGPPDAVSSCRRVVSAYADSVVATGGLGSALAVKLVNNLLFAANVQLTAAAIELGQTFGIDPGLLLSSIASCSGASYASAALARVSDPEQFGASAGPFLRKDVASCALELAASGADAGLLMEVVQRGPLPFSPSLGG